MTNSTISLPSVLRDFSPLSLVILQLLLATTVDVCGWGWEQVISQEVRHARQLTPACFWLWTKQHASTTSLLDIRFRSATIALVSVATSLRS